MLNQQFSKPEFLNILPLGNAVETVFCLFFAKEQPDEAPRHCHSTFGQHNLGTCTVHVEILIGKLTSVFFLEIDQLSGAEYMAGALVETSNPLAFG